MKKISIIISLLLFFISVSSVNAYKFDFVTVTDVVKKIQEKFGSLKTYQAGFTIESSKMNKKKIQSGTITYKADDKMLIQFTSPSSQKIIANGKMMWIYIPSMNVVAEQDLKADSGFFATGSKMGLIRLFSKYHYRFISKDQPELQKDGSKMYTLYLKQKESRSGYRHLKLWVSEDFMIRRAEGLTSLGKNVTISFNNIKKDINVQNGVFKFDVPSRARVIKNPMISEE